VFKKPDRTFLGGKKMKRILALLLVFATIFAFAACKKTDKDDNGTTTGGSKDAVVDVSADDTSDGSESSLIILLSHQVSGGSRPKILS
jgi:predicted small lipoprotein YifL